MYFRAFFYWNIFWNFFFKCFIVHIFIRIVFIIFIKIFCNTVVLNRILLLFHCNLNVVKVDIMFDIRRIFSSV